MTKGRRPGRRRWAPVLGLRLALAAALAPGASVAGAAGPAPPLVAQAADTRPCALGMVRQVPALRAVALKTAAVPWGRVRLTYQGHSGFLIETPGGASAVTDYNGVHVPMSVPDTLDSGWSLSRGRSGPE